MSALEKKSTYSAPTSGRNDRLSPIELPKNQAAELIDFLPNFRGLLDKAKGYSVDGSPFPNDPACFARLLYNYRKGTSLDLLLVAAADPINNSNSEYTVDIKSTGGDGVYSYIGHTVGTVTFTDGSPIVTGSGTTWTTNLKAGDKITRDNEDANYIEIQSVDSDTQLTLVSNWSVGDASGSVYTARIILSKDFLPKAVTFNDKAIITNGSEVMMAYDATSLNLIADADAPRARFVENHKARLFAAWTASDTSTIYWSMTNDESIWDAASIEDVFPQDGEEIVGIKSFGDSLLVFKNGGSIYQVIGNFDQDDIGEVSFIRKLDTVQNIGTIAPQSIVVHNDGCYFISDTGIYHIDYRMYIHKVSYDIDNYINATNFALGPSQNKSYNYDTDAQFNSGTYSGSRSSSNSLHPIFDAVTRTDATKRNGCSSVAIDSTNVVHVAYLDSSNAKKIKYLKLDVDGTITSEDAVTSVDDIYGLSIAVASNGNVGIAYHPGDFRSGFSVDAFGVSGNKAAKFIERVSSTWSGETNIKLTDGYSGGVLDGAFAKFDSISLVYNSSNDPRVAYGCNWAGPNNDTLYSHEARVDYAKRISGVWSANTIHSEVTNSDSYGSGDPAGDGNSYNVSLVLDGSDHPRVSYHFNHWDGSTKYIRAKYSNDESSWTNVESFSVNVSAKNQLQLNAAGDLITGYTDVIDGTFKKRNHTTTTTTTLDGDTYSLSLGFNINPVISADQEYYYNIVGSSPNAVEKAGFESGSTITNSTSNLIDKSFLPGDKAMVFNDRVFALVAFGVNSNDLVIRRLAFRSEWLSPETSDSTLSAWGTYDITQTTNNATITHSAAVNSSSPVTVFNTITNGSVVSSDSSKYFIQAKVVMVLGDFVAPQIDSVIINYVGAGVDCKQAFGISFQNELYLATSTASDTANSKVVLFDIAQKWGLLSYPVGTMCRYKRKLYAGLSTKGDVVVLRQGYLHGADAYTATYISKEDFLDSIDLEKDIFKVYVLFEVKNTGSFDFSYRLDNFKSGVAAWNTNNINQTSSSNTPGLAEILVGNKAHSIQFKIENSGSDEQCSIIGWTIVHGYLDQR